MIDRSQFNDCVSSQSYNFDTIGDLNQTKLFFEYN